MHGTLLEVGKSRVGHLNVTVDRNSARCLIGLVSDEITPYQVDATPRKTDQGCEFLVQPIGDRFKCEHTFP